jgi:hypothetical protein
VRELRPGLWHWEAPHPGWAPGEPWDQVVSSYAIDDGEQLVIVDPIAPPGDLVELAGERETAIVLTAPWHERDMQGLVEQLGVPVYSPPPDSAQYLMDTYGITAEQAGDGAPDLVWLRSEAPEHWKPYGAGDALPGGIVAYQGCKPNDCVLWVESQRAVIAGDSLADFGAGPAINERWLPKGVTRDHVVARLRPLLDEPVERFLGTHGGPFDRAALERALA